MKNFFKNIKNYVAEHKVKTIATAIAVILITVLIAIGITATRQETPKVAEKKIAKVETKKKAPKEEIKKETEVKQEEEAKSTDKAESPAPTTNKEETVNKPSKSTAKQSATGNTTSKPAAKPATKTPRWVVDRAAWTETKQVPVYDYVHVYKVYATEKATRNEVYLGVFYTYDEVKNCLLNADKNVYTNLGYEDTLEEKLIRTDTQTINHPEEGHWEY